MICSASLALIYASAISPLAWPARACAYIMKMAVIHLRLGQQPAPCAVPSADGYKVSHPGRQTTRGVLSCAATFAPMKAQCARPVSRYKGLGRPFFSRGAAARRARPLVRRFQPRERGMDSGVRRADSCGRGGKLGCSGSIWIWGLHQPTSVGADLVLA